MQPELVERHEREPASVKDGRELSIWPFVTSCGFAPMVLQTVPQCLSFSEERCPGQSVHVVSLGVSTTTWEWGISVSTPVPSNTPLWPWRLHGQFLNHYQLPRYYRQSYSLLPVLEGLKLMLELRHSWFNQLINPPLHHDYTYSHLTNHFPIAWRQLIPGNDRGPIWPDHLRSGGILVSLVVWCIQRRP